jgi:hypothetical protein
MKLRTIVSITASAPDPDQIVRDLVEDPARIPGVVRQMVKYAERLLEARPLIEKAKRRIEVENRTLVEANQKRQRKTTAKYELIRQFAGAIISANLKLQRASANCLAIKIHKLRPDWSIRTIRRALAFEK